MIEAGKLRHRVVIQKQIEVQDLDNGALNVTWQDIATVWSSIEPLSANEFIAAMAEASKVTTRITIRYRKDITAKMRLYHAAKEQYYNIEGVLADKDSGLEYITLPCSEGVRYQQDTVTAYVLPANTGIFNLVGRAADLIFDTDAYIIDADLGEFELVGNSAEFIRTFNLMAQTASFILTGNDATLERSSEYILSADTGTFILTGIDSNFRRTYRLNAQTASFIVTGNNTNLVRKAVMPAVVGAFTLTGIDATLTYVPAGGSFKVKPFTYTGTGSTQTISGIGFSPQLLLIKANGNADPNDIATIAISSLQNTSNVGPAASQWTNSSTPAEPKTGIINSYNADGFEISNNVTINANGKTYYGMALTGDSTEVYQGIYTGNGTSQSISGIGFQPDLVIIITKNASGAITYKHGSMGTNSNANPFSTFVATAITSLDADGFSIGNQTSVNVNGRMYQYIAIKAPSGCGEFATYNGNGTDNRTINYSSISSGAQFAFVKRNGASNPVFTTTSHPSDNSSQIGAFVNIANSIQSISSPTSMEIGTDATVNTNTNTYYYFALKSE